MKRTWIYLLVAAMMLLGAAACRKTEPQTPGNDTENTDDGKDTDENEDGGNDDGGNDDGGNDGGDGGDDGDDGGQEVPEATDLSADGSANCYVLSAGGTYSLDATTMGNGATTQGITPTALTPASAKLVWQTTAGMLSEVSLIEGRLYFSYDGTPGNALLAALDESGNIIWSWHIWAPEEEVAAVKAKSGYELMNMNLGACVSTISDEQTGAKTYGMLYQWGRKDPFPAAATLTGDTSTIGTPIYDADGNEVFISNSSWYSSTDNTLAYSIANPTVCLSNYSQYSSSRDWLAAGTGNDALWGNPDGLERDADNNYVNTGSKSIYDPCPAGWRVPPIDVLSYLTPSSGVDFTVENWDVADANGDGVISRDDFYYGWYVNMEEGGAFFPASARYDGSYAMLYGSVSGLWGNYWSNCPGSTSTGVAGLGSSCLSFMISDEYDMLSPNASGSRADAYAVRCIKE